MTAGATFTVSFNITALPTNPGGVPPNSYDAYGMEIVYAGNVSYVDTVSGSLVQTGAGVWTQCSIPTGDAGFTPGDALTGCTIGVGAASSTYLGTLAKLDFQCGASSGPGTLTLTPGAGKTELLDTGFTSYFEAASEALTINCLGATSTFTPTFTPTLTPTFTPNPNPQMTLDVTGDNVSCVRTSRPFNCKVPYVLGAEKTGEFTLQVKTELLPPGGVYGGIQTEVLFPGQLVYNTEICATEVVWDDLDPTTCPDQPPVGNLVRDKGTTGPAAPFPGSNFEGTLVELGVHCNAAGQFTLRLIQSATPTTQTAFIGTDGTLISVAATLGGDADQILLECTGFDPEMSLSASGPGVVCDTPTPPSTKPLKCSVPFLAAELSTPAVQTPFQIEVNANILPVNNSPSLNGYGGFSSEVVFGGLKYPVATPAPSCLSEAVWPSAFLCSQAPAAPAFFKSHELRSAIFPPFPASSYLGKLLSVSVTCPSAGQFQVVLPAYVPPIIVSTPARPQAAAYYNPMNTPVPVATVSVQSLDLNGDTIPETTPQFPIADVLLINCQAAPPTSTPTFTATPTASVTPTITNTATITNTPPATSTPSSTPTASNTPTPSNTPPATPSCFDSPGKATTDPEGDGATAGDPIEASVQLPISGCVTITQKTITQPSPAGFTLFGKQVNVTAPPGTAARPIGLTFWLDASIIPAGGTAGNIGVFKDGAPVPACTGTPGTASPNPCVAKRNLLTGPQAGDVQIAVLSSSASAWNFGLGSEGGGGTPTPTQQFLYILGDAGCDGDIDAADATVILQFVAGLIDHLNCPLNADADQDGQITPTDALVILQFVAALIDSLPPSGPAGAGTPWTGFAGLAALARGR